MFAINIQAAALSALVLAAAHSGAAPALAGQAPPLEGEFADNFNPLDPPVPAPAAAVRDRAGAQVRLADHRGRVVLLNFWATWCAPCLRELPSLDAVQAELQAEGLTVLAVSIDRGGFDAIDPFAERLELRHLAIYHDAEGGLFRAFGVSGLPTTFVIDRRGRVVGGYPGPAEWDSEAAVKLLRHYLRESGARPAGG